MGFGMILAIAILFGLYFPNATFLRLPQIVGTKLRELEPDDDVEVRMIGFTEPSLIFYKGGRIRPLPENFLREYPPNFWMGWIVLTQDVYDALPPERQRRLEQIASYRGFDYNIPMRPVTVIIARKRYVNPLK